MTKIEIKDLNVKFGEVHAVKNLSLTLNEGDFVALVGHNGAGKSTLIIIRLLVLKNQQAGKY